MIASEAPDVSLSNVGAGAPDTLAARGAETGGRPQVERTSLGRSRFGRPSVDGLATVIDEVRDGGA